MTLVGGVFKLMGSNVKGTERRLWKYCELDSY